MTYGLEFMGKSWDKINKHFSPAAKGNYPKSRNTKGVSYEAVDQNAMQQWHYEWAKEALRVAKPGAILMAFGGTRTSHRLACAIEDAGWELFDTICWLYGSGFPKSTNISKQIDKKLGKERKVVGKREHPTLKDKSKVDRQESTQHHGNNTTSDEWDLTEPASDEAKLWDGYGTAMKPAYEPVICARKPKEGTFAENALKWGVAGLNIDGGRVGTEQITTHSRGSNQAFPKRPTERTVEESGRKTRQDLIGANPREGRWPANLILSHHPECVRIGTKKVKSIKGGGGVKAPGKHGIYGNFKGKEYASIITKGDIDGNEIIEEYQCHPDCPIRLLNEQVGIKKSGTNCVRTKEGFFLEHGGMGKAGDVQNTYGDQGYVSRYFKNLPPDTNRFFYSPKASRSERNRGCERLYWKRNPQTLITKEEWDELPEKNRAVGNIHPTVKSLSLMKYLCNLVVSPTKGVILDLFGGSGTTGVVCEQLKIPYILIEKEADSCEISKHRIKAANDPKPIKKIKKVLKPTNTLFDWDDLDLEIK